MREIDRKKIKDEREDKGEGKLRNFEKGCGRCTKYFLWKSLCVCVLVLANASVIVYYFLRITVYLYFKF